MDRLHVNFRDRRTQLLTCLVLIVLIASALLIRSNATSNHSTVAPKIQAQIGACLGNPVPSVPKRSGQPPVSVVTLNRKVFHGSLQPGIIYSYCWTLSVKQQLPGTLTVVPLFRYGGDQSQVFTIVGQKISQKGSTLTVWINFIAGGTKDGQPTTYDVMLALNQKMEMVRFIPNPFFIHYAVEDKGTGFSLLPSDQMAGLDPWSPIDGYDMQYLGSPESLPDGSQVSQKQNPFLKRWPVSLTNYAGSIPEFSDSNYTVTLLWSYQGPSLEGESHVDSLKPLGSPGFVSLKFTAHIGYYAQVYAVCMNSISVCLTKVLTVDFTVGP